MKNALNMKNQYFLTVGAFLAAWAGSEFSLDHKAILFAILSGVFGYTTPKKK